MKLRPTPRSTIRTQKRPEIKGTNTNNFTEINFRQLCEKFPGFIFAQRVLEIVGYNPNTNQYLIIDDGMCTSDSGYVCHVYNEVKVNPSNVYDIAKFERDRKSKEIKVFF